jgi:hypothetical protein
LALAGAENEGQGQIFISNFLTDVTMIIDNKN